MASPVVGDRTWTSWPALKADATSRVTKVCDVKGKLPLTTSCFTSSENSLDYGLGEGLLPSPILSRYVLQTWVVPCASIFTIFSSRVVSAVNWQLPNRFQKYDLDSPVMEVVSYGPIAVISSEMSRFCQRVTIVDEISRC